MPRFNLLRSAVKPGRVVRNYQTVDQELAQVIGEDNYEALQTQGYFQFESEDRLNFAIDQRASVYYCDASRNNIWRFRCVSPAMDDPQAPIQDHIMAMYYWTRHRGRYVHDTAGFVGPTGTDLSDIVRGSRQWIGPQLIQPAGHQEFVDDPIGPPSIPLFRPGPDANAINEMTQVYRNRLRELMINGGIAIDPSDVQITEMAPEDLGLDSWRFTQIHRVEHGFRLPYDQAGVLYGLYINPDDHAQLSALRITLGVGDHAVSTTHIATRLYLPWTYGNIPETRMYCPYDYFTEPIVIIPGQTVSLAMCFEDTGQSTVGLLGEIARRRGNQT